MALLVIASADVGCLNLIEADKLTLPAEDATLAKGQMVRINVTTGRFTLANGTSAAEARVYGMLINSANKVGDPVTAVRRGIVAVGEDASVTGLTFDDIVYLSDTDGKLGDAAGTVSTVVGRTVPQFNGSATAKKMLKIEL